MSDVTLSTLPSTSLAHVTGGAGAQGGRSFDGFVNELRDSMRKTYKGFVCDAAGLKGGAEFAQKVYGANASDADKIRASQMIRSYCNAGSQLPAAAPAFPF